MFTLDELKEIRKKYRLRDFKTLEARKKDESITFPENLSNEEKSKIVSALFLYRIIKEVKAQPFNKNKSEQEILDEIQVKFPQEVLSPEPKTVSGFVLIAGKPLDYIMIELAKPNGELNYMAEAYLQYTLAEKGKKAMNIQRSIEGGLGYNITYDITNLERKNDFIKSLNPNNPMYTQPPKVQALTPEQKAYRRAYVEKAIKYYNMMEHDEWYQHRIEREDKNMQRVARIVNNHEQMMPIKNGPGLFYLLKAAQNLSITGEKDYLEEILSQPEVNKALLEFKSSEQAKMIKMQALQNQQDGKINGNGLLQGHNLSQGEKENHSAQVCIHQNPKAVSEARQVMSKQSRIEFGTTTDDIRLSNLYSLIARTQGKIPLKTRTLDSIIFDTDTGIEK